MKICFTLILIYFFVNTNTLFAESVEEKWPSGNILKKYSRNNENKKTGAYTEFYENGQIKIKANYNNDQLEGFYYEFLENGKKSLDTQYTKGLKNGLNRIYTNGLLTKEEIWVDGLLAFPHSILEITQTLHSIEKLKTEFIGEFPKDFKEERFTKIIENDNIAGLTKLREYRYLCGLPYEDLQINKSYIAHNLDAVLILKKLNGLTHQPINPGLPENTYQSGYKGTMCSNLTWSNYGMCASLSVDIYMDDSEQVNLEFLGHRRWCLNPQMQATGFALDGCFSAMWTQNIDREKITSFDYICFPAKGFMPNSHFKNINAWSVTLNPNLYRLPEKESVTINISSVKNSIKNELKISYQNIDKNFIGINNCIIFKPENISTAQKSRYFVSIKGLKDIQGKDTKIEYFMEFFNYKPDK